MHVFGTKAETLEFLFHHQKEIGAGVLSLRYFSAEDWRERQDVVWQEVERSLPASSRLIVRSSARGEDGAEASQAGKYESVLCDWSEEKFGEAVDHLRRVPVRHVAVQGPFPVQERLGSIGRPDVFLNPAKAAFLQIHVCRLLLHTKGPYLEKVDLPLPKGKLHIQPSGVQEEFQLFQRLAKFS